MYYLCPGNLLAELCDNHWVELNKIYVYAQTNLYDKAILICSDYRL